MKTILAIGAHFDDLEIGAAGTLIKHVEKGDVVYIAVLYADEFRTGKPNERLLEQYEALKLLGITKKFLIVMKSDDNDYNIISELDKIQPDIVYTSYWNDTHQDHRRCSRIGQSVGRKPYITTLFYAGASAISFNPTVFVNIDFDKKMEILNCYKSQKFHGSINVERVKRREHYWGTMISSEDHYAEGFVIHKMEINI